MSHEPTDDESLDSGDDVTFAMLRDAAEVHSARGEVGPAVQALLGTLMEDPLGKDDTVESIASILDTPRSRSARAARERLIRTLAAGYPHEVRAS